MNLYPLFRVLLVDPNGYQHEVTDRLADDEATKLEEASEETLAALTHSDLSLSFLDADGFVRRLFGELDPDTYWTVIVERETLRRRPRWERIFGGVLDLPWSVQYEPKDSLVHVQAFSFSKYLDVQGAEDVTRSLDLGNGSSTAGSATVTLGSTTGLIRGDVVKLDDGTKNESFIVDKIDSATQITATKNAAQTITSGSAKSETLFYRFKTPDYLISALAALTNVDQVDAQLDADLAEYPVMIPISAEGTRYTGRPVSLVSQTGYLTATYPLAHDANRRKSNDITAAWVAGTASNDVQGDWTPYLTSEPATVMSYSFDGGWDHTNGRLYRLVEVDAGAPTFATRLHLYERATDKGSFASIASGESYDTESVEYDPVNDVVWVSYSASDGQRHIEKYSVAGSSFSDFDTTRSGELKCCRRKNLMVFQDDTSWKLRFYDLTTSALVKEIDAPEGTNVLMSTFRQWDTYFGVFTFRKNATYFTVWDSNTYEVVADYRVSDRIFAAPVCCPWTLSDGREVLACYVNGDYFVVSKRYDGVIPYANFEGMSAAAALRDIALLLNCYVRVDANNLVTIHPRAYIATDSPVLSIDDDDVLERESIPIWEHYRTSAKVSGEDDEGKALAVVSGVPRDEARQISVSSPLITTYSLASAIGNLIVSYLSLVRREENLLIRERGTLIRPLDRVQYDSIAWLCIEAKSDLTSRQQELRLVEANS